MKKLLLSLMAAALMLAFLATFGLAASGGVTDPDALKALAAARQARAGWDPSTYGILQRRLLESLISALEILLILRKNFVK